MMELVSSKGRIVAVSAAALAVFLTILVPAGHPWPSLASAALAFAAALWMVKMSVRPPQMSEVIVGVEAEPAAGTAPPRGRAASPKAMS